jgi:hypothetical protein
VTVAAACVVDVAGDWYRSAGGDLVKTFLAAPSSNSFGPVLPCSGQRLGQCYARSDGKHMYTNGGGYL